MSTDVRRAGLASEIARKEKLWSENLAEAAMLASTCSTRIRPVHFLSYKKTAENSGLANAFTTN
jgi:hypothetical protein